METVNKLGYQGCALYALVFRRRRKFLFFSTETTESYYGRGINPLMAYRELMKRIPTEEDKKSALYFPVTGDLVQIISDDGTERFDVKVKSDFIVSYDYDELIRHATGVWEDDDVIPGGLNIAELRKLRKSGSTD